MTEEGSQIPPLGSDASTATGSDPDSAAAEEAALSAGLSVEDLQAQATIPRIPPLSVEEQAAAITADNSQAVAEEKSLSKNCTPEELADIARNREADREQRFKDAFEHIAIQVLYIGATVIGVLAVIWALHLVLPEDKRWLTSEQLTHLQTLLTAGVLVGVVNGHFKKRMGGSNSEK